MSDDAESAIGCLGLVAIGVTLWLTWPICLWGAIGLGAAWCAHELKGWAEGGGRKRRRGAILFGALAKDFRDVALCVAVGLGVIAGTQLVLNAGWMFVSDNTVRGWENGVMGAYERIKGMVGLRPLGITLAVLVGINLIFPRLRLVTWVNDRKKAVSRLIVVLTVISSFTFFSTLQVDGLEQTWLARRKPEIAGNLQRIATARQTLVAHAVVERELKALTPHEADYVSEFLRQLEPVRVDREEILELRVEEMAGRAPKLETPNHNVQPEPALGRRAAGNPSEGMFDSLLSELRLWVQIGDSSGYRPSLRDFHRCETEAKRIETAMAQSETALIEIAKTAFGGAVAGPFDSMMQPFVKSLVGTLTKSALSSVFPKSVHDLATAALWLKLATTPPTAEAKDKHPLQEWRLEVRPAETRVSTGPPLGAQVAAAASIAVLSAKVVQRREQAAAARAASRGYPSSWRPSSYTPRPSRRSPPRPARR